MTIQEAIHTILIELKRPLSSKELAKMALERHMVASNAKDPVFSLASTVEKNIRDGIYNHPRLICIFSQDRRRLIGLPEWGQNQPPQANLKIKELIARIPEELFNQIQLAVQAKLEGDFNETVAYLLRSGLAVSTPAIKGALMKQINELAK